MGSNQVTVVYIDSITSTEYSVSYQLEVIDRNTYERYKTLGIIEPEPTIETQWLVPESEGPDYEQMLSMLGMTQEQAEAMEDSLGK